MIKLSIIFKELYNQNKFICFTNKTYVQALWLLMNESFAHNPTVLTKMNFNFISFMHK